MTRRAVILFGLGAALIAIPAGWYFGSPWWTLWRVREAARAGDAERLASYVDFPAVRANAKAGIRAEWRSVLDAVGAEGPGRDKLSAFAARRLSDPAVDALVRPETLRPWLAGMSLRFAGRGGGGTGYRPEIERRSLNEFIVRDSQHRGGALTFRRHGFGWKLEAARWGEQ
jgi:hypothetical protein